MTPAKRAPAKRTPAKRRSAALRLDAADLMRRARELRDVARRYGDRWTPEEHDGALAAADAIERVARGDD